MEGGRTPKVPLGEYYELQNRILHFVYKTIPCYCRTAAMEDTCGKTQRKIDTIRGRKL